MASKELPRRQAFTAAHLQVQDDRPLSNRAEALFNPGSQAANLQTAVSLTASFNPWIDGSVHSIGDRVLTINKHRAGCSPWLNCGVRRIQSGWQAADL